MTLKITIKGPDRSDVVIYVTLRKASTADLKSIFDAEGLLNSLPTDARWHFELEAW